MARITSDPEAPEMFHFGLYALALAGTLVYVTYYRLLMRDATTRFPVAVATLMTLFYYFLIGYLIANVPRQGSVVYAVVGLVFVLHSLGTNHQLRRWHQPHFDRYVRWLLAVSVIAGWLAGSVADVPIAAVAYATAFMSGGILTIALSEELPLLEDTRLPEFLVGVALFSVIAFYIRSYRRIRPTR